MREAAPRRWPSALSRWTAPQEETTGLIQRSYRRRAGVSGGCATTHSSSARDCFIVSSPRGAGTRAPERSRLGGARGQRGVENLRGSGFPRRCPRCLGNRAVKRLTTCARRQLPSTPLPAPLVTIPPSSLLLPLFSPPPLPPLPASSLPLSPLLPRFRALYLKPVSCSTKWPPRATPAVT